MKTPATIIPHPLYPNLHLHLNPLPASADGKEIKSKSGSKIKNFALVRLTSWLAALAIVPAARAATYTWSGTGFFGQDYLWSNDFNWAGGVAPSAGEANVTIIFPNNGAPKVTTNDIVGLSVAAIQFQGSSYVVHGKPAGNALGLQSSGLAGWAITASASGCSFASTCPLSLNSYGVVGVASGCTLSVLSSIGGTGGLTKVSPGTLKFSAPAANTYSGTTSVGDGTLDLNSGVFAPSVMSYVSVPGPLVIGGTNQAYSPLVRLLFDDQIANTAPITVNQNGRLWLNGHDDTLGPLTVTDGGIVSTGIGGGSSSPGLLTLNGDVTSPWTGSAQEARIDGRLDLGLFTRTFQVEFNLRLGADVSGSSIFNPGLTKTGPGLLALMGDANSYVGPTLIQQGTLALGGVSTPGSTNAGTTVAAGARLDLNQSQIGNEPLVLNGQINAETIRFTGTNEWAGSVTLNGPCHLSDNSSPGDPENHITFSGVISGAGSLRKTGAGRLHFTGFGGNTFTGGLFCEEGWTYLSKSASAHALNGPLVAGRDGEQSQWVFVEITQLNQIPNSLPITLLDHGSLATETGITETLGPVEIKGGLLFGDGTITLSGDITNRLSTNGVGYLTGNVTLPATRIFHCDAGSSLQTGGNIAGSGGVTKTGAGELLFGGAHTYAGLTLVKEGSLRLENIGRPGSSAAGTTIEANGVLYLNGASVTNESLALYGGGADGVALIHHNTNVWSGPVEIHSGANIKAEPAAQLSILGTITGDGGLTHFGDGTLTFGGNFDNTYAGPTTFRVGTFNLSKNGAFAIPHSLVVGYATNGAPPAIVKCAAASQLTPLFGAELGLGGVTLNPSTTLDCGGFNQTVANLYLKDAKVDTGGGVLSLAGNLDVQTGPSGYSYLFGNLQLTTGVVASHIFNVATDGHLVCTASLTESGTQNIYKDGDGSFGNLGSVNFNGTLTIHRGVWMAANANPFGSAAGPTIVEAGGTLAAFAGSFSEPLQLAGSGADGLGALYSNSTNKFTSPITLTADAMIVTDTNAILTLSGAVNGAGGLTKQGGGTLQFLGSAPNSYAGTTLVTSGKLELGKTNVVAVAGPLTITGPNSSSSVRLLQPEQIGNLSPVVLQDTGWIALDGNNETIGSLAGVGAIYQSGGQSGLLTAGGDGTSTTFNGIIHGGGGLTKTGSGTFTLTGNNLYTGTTTVSAGKLVVNGQQPQSAISILTGGTLGGYGRVGHIGELNGNVAPGASLGILVCSNYSTFTPANLLQIEIAGTTPGSEYDQLQVNGSVLLMGGTLQVAMNFSGAVSNQYVIVSNDGADNVTGTFTGLPEGAMLTNNSVAFQITYHGGDGNDIALTQLTKVAGPQITGIQKLANGSVQLSGAGVPNAQYVVEATQSLTPPASWTFIGTATADANGQFTFTDADAPNFSSRFYRFKLQ